jgi:hypothetical protein
MALRMQTEKEIVDYIDQNNLCSHEVGGCWLTKETYYYLLDYYPQFETVIWLLKHNAEATEQGCNIGSTMWQHYRKTIL